MSNIPENNDDALLEDKANIVELKYAKLKVLKSNCFKIKSRMEMIIEICDINKHNHHKWIELLNKLNSNYSISISKEKQTIKDSVDTIRGLKNMVNDYILTYHNGADNHG
jgi:hypothetical protein